MVIVRLVYSNIHIQRCHSRRVVKYAESELHWFECFVLRLGHLFNIAWLELSHQLMGKISHWAHIEKWDLASVFGWSVLKLRGNLFDCLTLYYFAWTLPTRPFSMQTSDSWLASLQFIVLLRRHLSRTVFLARLTSSRYDVKRLASIIFDLAEALAQEARCNCSSLSWPLTDGFIWLACSFLQRRVRRHVVVHS